MLAVPPIVQGPAAAGCSIQSWVGWRNYRGRLTHQRLECICTRTYTFDLAASSVPDSDRIGVPLYVCGGHWLTSTSPHSTALDLIRSRDDVVFIPLPPGFSPIQFHNSPPPS